MEADILVEISDKDLPKIRELFKQNWPYYMNVWYFIDNYIDWKERGVTDIKFYAPDGKWDDGTLVAIEENIVFQIFVITLEKSCNRLRKALQETKRIKWDEPDFMMLFVTVHESVYPTVTNIIKDKGWATKHEDIAKMWWLSKEESLKLDSSVPEGTYIAPLKVEDVPIINSIWPHKNPWSHEYLKLLIEVNGGIGLYDKKSHELCSWIMKNNYGGLAILQTSENHKRKGYATTMTKHFSKYLAEKGLDNFCFIMTHNIQSQQLFQKLGFKMAHGINWIHIEK